MEQLQAIIETFSKEIIRVLVLNNQVVLKVLLSVSCRL
jgi:hypothetical protein